MNGCFNIVTQVWLLYFFIMLTDFARLHDQLISQEESCPGFLPRNMLPHLPSKKLLSTRYVYNLFSHEHPTRSSMSSLYIDRRRAKLGKYINTLVSLPGALENQLSNKTLIIIYLTSFLVKGFLELQRVTLSSNLTNSPFLVFLSIVWSDWF